ncbi:MAG: type II toxin-antitoxin system Phd/YefM family antitoxin [Acidaminococcaceae bacterium]|nr:type II toxin-antitoxin system Phd/YefM family antitoxin [Acidaminococcaceae bacterium]
MIHIKPVSDLRNKYTEIEQLVLNEQQPVFLTKNGYGTMVVMSIEAYAKLTDPTESALDLADREAAVNSQRLTHEDVFSSIRRKINGGK